MTKNTDEYISKETSEKWKSLIYKPIDEITDCIKSNAMRLNKEII